MAPPKTDIAAPALTPEPGWTPISNKVVRPEGTMYLSGDPDPLRVRLRYFERDSDGAIVGKAWWGPHAEGPPGHAHGGSIMAVLDEAMGKSAWHAGVPVLAAKVTVSFRRVLPLGVEVQFEAWIERHRGKKLRTRGRLLTPDGQVYAEGDGLFIQLDAERLAEFGALMVEQEHAGARLDEDGDPSTT